MNALIACHRAHWAWVKTQPQLVIPGVLDEPDLRVPTVGFVEPAGMSRRLPPGGLATSNGTGRRTIPGSRGRCQKGEPN